MMGKFSFCLNGEQSKWTVAEQLRDTPAEQMLPDTGPSLVYSI